MEQSAGLLMITMLINQTIRSRSRYRKKGGWLNTNGPNMLAIVTADFLKGGPEFLPVFDANAIKIDTSTPICSSDKKQNSMPQYSMSLSHPGKSWNQFVQRRSRLLCVVFPGLLVQFTDPAIKNHVLQSVIVWVHLLWSSFMQLNRQQDFSC